MQEILDSWLSCQGSWMYLEPIFSSEDIIKQMPLEGEKFVRVDAQFRTIMSDTQNAPAVIPIARSVELLEVRYHSYKNRH